MTTSFVKNSFVFNTTINIQSVGGERGEITSDGNILSFTDIPLKLLLQHGHRLRVVGTKV